MQAPVRVEPRARLSQVPGGYVRTAEAGGDFSGAKVVHQGNERSSGADRNGVDREPGVEQIIDAVFALESSRGKQDSCRAKGKWNGFGYIPGSCYDSHEKVRGYVESWFRTKLETYSLPHALCGYNLGFSSTAIDACIASSDEYPYYRNFLKIINQK